MNIKPTAKLSSSSFNAGCSDHLALYEAHSLRKLDVQANANQALVMLNKIVISLAIFLALSACATPEVVETAPNFDEEKFAEDLNNCRGGTFLEASVKSVGYAMVGSAYGAFHGLLAGTLHGESAQGAAIGAAVGATVGIGAGAFKALEKEEGKIASCLRGKGYTIVSGGSPDTADQDGPVNVTCEDVEVAQKEIMDTYASYVSEGNGLYMGLNGHAFQKFERCDGQGNLVLDPNNVEALKWYTLAVRHDYTDAEADRKSLSDKMTSTKIAEAEKRASEWMARFDARKSIGLSLIETAIDAQSPAQELQVCPDKVKIAHVEGEEKLLDYTCREGPGEPADDLKECPGDVEIIRYKNPRIKPRYICRAPIPSVSSDVKNSEKFKAEPTLAPVTNPTNSLVGRLRSLKSLLEKGLITKEEAAQERKTLLEKL